MDSLDVVMQVSIRLDYSDLHRLTVVSKARYLLVNKCRRNINFWQQYMTRNRIVVDNRVKLSCSACDVLCGALNNPSNSHRVRVSVLNFNDLDLISSAMPSIRDKLLGDLLGELIKRGELQRALKIIGLPDFLWSETVNDYAVEELIKTPNDYLRTTIAKNPVRPLPSIIMISILTSKRMGNCINNFIATYGSAQYIDLNTIFESVTDAQVALLLAAKCAVHHRCRDLQPESMTNFIRYPRPPTETLVCLIAWEIFKSKSRVDCVLQIVSRPEDAELRRAIIDYYIEYLGDES